MKLFINQEVRITNFYYKMDLEIQYYLNQLGIVKGIKKIKKTYLYT